VQLQRDPVLLQNATLLPVLTRRADQQDGRPSLNRRDNLLRSLESWRALKDRFCAEIVRRAEALFGSFAIIRLSLFTESGRELPSGETVEHAGIVPDEKLYLRLRPHREVFDIIIIYNGIKKPLKVKVDELIEAVLLVICGSGQGVSQRADFGIAPHLFLARLDKQNRTLRQVICFCDIPSECTDLSVRMRFGDPLDLNQRQAKDF
jgi:hypothetical protein